MQKWDLEKNIIFEAVAGSRLFGTHTPDSDYDRRGICLVPAEVQLDLFQKFEQQDSFATEKERVIFALDKFFLLCANSNPNLIELLFAPRANWLVTSPVWEKIYAQRTIFLSQIARQTFWGYALEQLKRIERHRKWIINPPLRQPTRQDFDLPVETQIGAEHLAAILAIPSNYIQPEFRWLAEQEKKYRQEKIQWEQYDQWQKTRNPARFALEQKYHFDCKHGMHLVRLLGEGEELLLTGQITFPRPDAAELLAIKNGQYNYSEMMTQIASWEKKYQNLALQSVLPLRPDYQKINQLYAQLVSENCFCLNRP